MVDQARAGRLAEVTIALSLASDLGTGQPMEHGMRTCWLSRAAAEALGLDPATRSAVYYVALLRFIGCTSDASETAVLAGGDDVAFNAAMAPMQAASPGEGMRYFVRHLAEDLPLRRRAGRVVRAMADPGMERRSLSGHCEVAARLAARLSLPESLCDPLGAYERWDGKGHPAGLGGDEISVAVRVVAAARDAELWARQAGWQAAADVLAHRRGHAHDPAVIDTLVAHGEGWLAAIGDDPCAAVLDAEPEPVATIRPEELDGALAAVADFADLKSPYFPGHSSGVAELSVAAAKVAGLSDADAADIGRAALVHDVGRVGVPSGIWDRPGPLSAEQWERVRLHPYLSERVLHRCALLAPFAALPARHHVNRADASRPWRPRRRRAVTTMHAKSECGMACTRTLRHSARQTWPRNPHPIDDFESKPADEGRITTSLECPASPPTGSAASSVSFLRVPDPRARPAVRGSGEIRENEQNARSII